MLPELNDDIVLYGDLIACKFINDKIIDLNTNEYENFFMNLLEGGNTNIEDNQDIIDIDEPDEGNDEIDEIDDIVLPNNKLLLTNNDFDEIDDNVEDFDYDENIIDDDDENIEYKINNGELIKEEYDYSYLKNHQNYITCSSIYII